MAVLPFPVAPVPAHGAVMVGRDVAGRVLRVSAHPEVDRVVLSVWQGPRCVSTFRLSAAEVPELIRILTGVMHASGEEGPSDGAIPSSGAIPLGGAMSQGGAMTHGGAAGPEAWDEARYGEPAGRVPGAGRYPRERGAPAFPEPMPRSQPLPVIRRRGTARRVIDAVRFVFRP